MTVTAFLLAVQATAATAPPPSQTPRDIIVVAPALDRTAKALAACIARNCPPDQEVDAALSHAEAQFVNGGYLGARATVAQTLGRLKGQAKAYPVPVADLYLVQSRLSLHLGEGSDAQSNSMRAIRALRAGLPADDPRVFAQRIELADTRVRLRDHETAIEMLSAIEREAMAAGQPAMATYAKFKRAILYGVLGESDARFSPTARKLIRELGDISDPALRPFGDAAAVLASRLKLRGDKGPALDDLMARAGNSASPEPVLLYSPPMEELETARLPRADGQSVLSQIATDADYVDQWINIGFRIGADGRVEDVEPLQRSASFSGWWLPKVTKAIAARRYAPLSGAQARSARRVERYTLTSLKTNVTGSRVERREARAYVQMLDITPRPVPVTAR